LNLILFKPAEISAPLPRHDPRARHILEILRLKPDGSFDAGLIDGPRGKGRLIATPGESLLLDFTWNDPPPPLSPLHLVIGLPRPQTARDILRDSTSLGVAAMHFVKTEKGESSYAGSSLWKSSEWQQCLINGAAQAFCTRLPKVSHGRMLSETLVELPVDSLRIALDNYEATASLGSLPVDGNRPVVLAIGAERGWAPAERVLLINSGFVLAGLGPRVLRSETACVAAITLIKSKAGWF
jgi:16S rRNA (uracil1498-N3)-methyltransferase